VDRNDDQHAPIGEAHSRGSWVHHHQALDLTNVLHISGLSPHSASPIWVPLIFNIKNLFHLSS
jgi:hypothetical protein